MDFFLERRSSHDDDAHLESISPLETLEDCSSRGQGGSQVRHLVLAGQIFCGHFDLLQPLSFGQ